MSQRRFDLVLKSKLVITPGIVQPPEAMGLQEDRVAVLHPKTLMGQLREPIRQKKKREDQNIKYLSKSKKYRSFAEKERQPS